MSHGLWEIVQLNVHHLTVLAQRLLQDSSWFLLSVQNM